MADFIQFGDIPPEILKSLTTTTTTTTSEAPENQDSGESHEDDHSQSSSQNQAPPADESHESPRSSEATHIQSPRSAQLRFSLPQKPPRRTPLLAAAFSRTRPLLTFSPPPAAVNRRTNVVVPSNWSADNRLGHPGTYLSKESLLPKMYKRWGLSRTFLSFAGVNITPLKEANVEVLGTPVDYWLTFPLKPPEFSAVQRTTVCSTGPIKSTRETLNRNPSTGAAPLAGRPFPWVTNLAATKLCTCTNLVNSGIKKITGFVECPKCNNFWGIAYSIDRFVVAGLYLAGIRSDITAYGEKALQFSHFSCKCDGKENPVRPFISDDYRKINWMCLLLGFGLGFCRLDQLIFYCENRKLEIPAENMNHILLYVCADLLKQVSVM